MLRNADITLLKHGRDVEAKRIKIRLGIKLLRAPTIPEPSHLIYRCSVSLRVILVYVVFPSRGSESLDAMLDKVSL